MTDIIKAAIEALELVSGRTWPEIEPTVQKALALLRSEQAQATKHPIIRNLEREKLCSLLISAMDDYRCKNQRTCEAYGLPLSEALTPPGKNECSIGRNEMERLADYLARRITEASNDLRATPPKPEPVSEERAVEILAEAFMRSVGVAPDQVEKRLAYWLPAGKAAYRALVEAGVTSLAATADDHSGASYPTRSTPHLLG